MELKLLDRWDEIFFDGRYMTIALNDREHCDVKVDADGDVYVLRCKQNGYEVFRDDCPIGHRPMSGEEKYRIVRFAREQINAERIVEELAT